MTPRKKPDTTGGLVQDAIAPPAESMSNEDIEAIAAEVIDPSAVAEFVTVGGRDFPVKFLKWQQERQFMRVIAPVLRYLITAATLGEFHTAFGALLSESEGDLTQLSLIILQTHDASLDEAWLDEHARMSELIDLVTEQVKKDKVVDTLGKLWGPGVLTVKVMEGLNTLSLLAGSVNTPP